MCAILSVASTMRHFRQRFHLALYATHLDNQYSTQKAELLLALAGIGYLAR